MHSPSVSFTMSCRSNQMKRSRSPDSPNERPMKRLSLAVVNDYSHPMSSPIRFATGFFQAQSTMTLSSEDTWVSQACGHGWRIESSAISQPQNQYSVPSREDDMVMDCDSFPKHPTPRTCQTNCIHTINPRATQQLLTPPPDYISASPSASTAHRSSQINIQQSTVPTRTHSIDSIMPVPTPSASQTIPIPASPTGSGVRKVKFTMGPRGDCEKCRLGVKGHWMHFD